MSIFKKENPDSDNAESPAGATHKPEPSSAKAEPGRTIEVDEAQYQKQLQELAEYKDRCVRLYAEFENTRKRFERDRVEFVKYANEGLVVDFLNILDDLERAVNAAATKHEDYEAFLKGVEIVMGRILDLLKRNEVKPIEAAGKKFDPHCHEILLQVPAEGQEEGLVLEELQRGYYLGDRVIRTAKVKVAINPPQASATESSEKIKTDNG